MTAPERDAATVPTLPYHVLECEFEETYSLLVGPDDFECLLGEPEDRSWYRDGSGVVDELNRLHACATAAEAAAADLRARVDALTAERAALEAACADLRARVAELEREAAAGRALRAAADIEPVRSLGAGLIGVVLPLPYIRAYDLATAPATTPTDGGPLAIHLLRPGVGCAAWGINDPYLCGAPHYPGAATDGDGWTRDAADATCVGCLRRMADDHAAAFAERSR